MRVFNEEDVKTKKDFHVILVLKQKEARDLIEAMEAAVKSNKRKRTWKRIYDKLAQDACCY